MQVVLSLPTTDGGDGAQLVEVDVMLSAHANARLMYENKKNARAKELKTLEVGRAHKKHRHLRPLSVHARPRTGAGVSTVKTPAGTGVRFIVIPSLLVTPTDLIGRRTPE